MGIEQNLTAGGPTIKTRVDSDGEHVQIFAEDVSPISAQEEAANAILKELKKINWQLTLMNNEHAHVPED